ncbi:MAG: Eco57I restriction-modification methylase domain-containing protein, partial [Nannocystaceae bacterium]
LHQPTFLRAQARLIECLQSEGFGNGVATTLAQTWMTQDDFLLSPLHGRFDVIVGNPPYVRQERIPQALLAAYKQRFTTLYDRADLYVLFFERCLDLLRQNGVLGFICANRWVKNKYGGPLRAKIAKGFNLDYYIDMEQVDAFQKQVHAYPAVTVIRRSVSTKTAVVTRANGTKLEAVFKALRSRRWRECPQVTSVHNVASGRDPWLVDAPEIIDTIRQLERNFPTLKQAGVNVGIGVATGADKVYIGNYDELPVEMSRRLKLAVSADLTPNGLVWTGKGLVNPWEQGGQLASLEKYPQFANYLTKHARLLKKRHTAKKSPRAWYKTIDRVYPSLTSTPKLLIPDIKGAATVVFDAGHYYPHHNLYVITSDTWDLQALQAFLKSSIALTFVAAYCVRMAGGFLRFQAQYLRRIRVPMWQELTASQRRSLLSVANSTDQDAIDEVVFSILELPLAAVKKIRAFAQAARVGKKRA